MVRRSGKTRSPRAVARAAHGWNAARSAHVRRALGAWFDVHRRALPWRADRDPYRVWVSEAMLQQTRVEVVVPYYTRFLERFPDVAALARAPLDEVLAAWSGLGYYRRARTLQATARALVAQHAGRFPRERAALSALPGIGPYTAGAIASIAFDLPEALVDGNVERVFARWFALEGARSSGVLRRASWERAQALVPARSGAGDWNQALMELGALVCTPRNPRCERCPVAEHCRAFATGRIDEFPAPRVRAPSVQVTACVALVERDEHWLFEQRARVSRMEGLWQFPSIESSGAADARERLFRASWPEVEDAGGVRVGAVREGAVLGELRHTITCHRLRVAVKRCTLVGTRLPPDYRWIHARDVAEIPITGMTRKVLAARFFESWRAQPQACT